MPTMYTEITTSLGEFLALSDGHVLTALYFVGQKYMPAVKADWQRDQQLPIFLQASQQLHEYCAGNRRVFEVPYRFAQGTPFQQKVWHAIASVPYGTTISYSQLALAIKAPSSTRAVAAAVGRNPLSLIVPCHRIIGSDGSLTGYAGGIERKKASLDLEQVNNVNSNIKRF